MEKAHDAKERLDDNQKDAADKINSYMKDDHSSLHELLTVVDPELKKSGRIMEMGRHIRFGQTNDYDDIIYHDVPSVMEAAETMALAGSKNSNNFGFEELLHSAIIESSLPQYKNGHLRDAVLNSVTAVFDMIRARTDLKIDGKDLVGQAFGMEKGKLVFSEIDTETGKNDQRGFLQVFEGLYTGVRNVKAHSLNHDLDDKKAAQYLIAMSLLARRVDECIERPKVAK